MFLKPPKRAATFALAALAVTANILAVITAIPWIAAVILVLLLIIAYLSYLLVLNRAPDAGLDIVECMREAVGGALPDAGYLLDFYASTVLPHLTTPDSRMVNPDLHLSLYLRSSRVAGTDVHAHREYHGSNLGPGVVSGFRVVTFGGASLKSSEMSTRLSQVERDGTYHLPAVTTEVDEERFKVLYVQFRTPLSVGGTFRVEFDYVWPGAMWWGTDSIAFSEILCYPRGVDRVESILEFDSSLSHIGAYSFDLLAGECNADSVQPELAPTEDFGDRYHWSIVNPGSNRLYFIAFTRTRAEDTGSE